MRRLVKYLGVSWLLLVLVLLGAALGLMGSELGSRWLVAKIPGISVEAWSGKLGGHWQADVLVWQQGATRIEAHELSMTWSPACLWRLQLCLEQLVVGRLELVLPEENSQDNTPVSLPDVQLPLAINIAQLKLGSVLINNVEQLSQLQLKANWQQGYLKLHTVNVVHPRFSGQLQGVLETMGNWPLTLQGHIHPQAPTGQPWKVTLALSGELQQELQLEAESQGYFPGRLQIQMHPLATELPLHLSLQGQAFHPGLDLPENLGVQDVQLLLEGSLLAGYDLEGQLSVKGEDQPIRLILGARVWADHLQLKQLDLLAGVGQQVQIQGEATWKEDLQGVVQLNWANFPWQSLYPLSDPLPVDLQQLQARLEYTNGRYQGQMAASLQGPAGAFRVSTPLSGSLKQLSLPDLQVQAGQGQAKGHLSLDWGERTRWEAQLQLAELNPAFWVAKLPGQLRGELFTQGQLHADGGVTAEARLGLQGKLRGQPTEMQLQAQGAKQAWQLKSLFLKMGRNSLSGDLVLDDVALDGGFNLQLSELAQLWPGLAGGLKGHLKLAGTLDKPQGSLQLRGQQLAYQQNKLQQLTLQARLGEQWQSRLKVLAKGLQAAGQDWGKLQLQGSGSSTAHTLMVNLDGPKLDMKGDLSGTLDTKGNWKAKIQAMQLSGWGQNWQLQKTLPLEQLTDGSFTLGAHCWASDAARLCAQKQQLLPTPQLRLQLRNFSLASLSGLLPENLAWQGTLNGEVAVDIPAGGPTGKIGIQALPGSFQVREPGQAWVDLPYEKMQLQARLQSNLVTLDADIDSDSFGLLKLVIQVDPRDQSLDGRFQLEALDIAAARPFLLGVENIGGQLRGQGHLGGTLNQPHIEGLLALSAGQLSGPQLPLQIRDLKMQLDIAGEQGQLRGSWRSGNQGQGELSGTLEWRSGIQAQLQLSGQDLPVRVEPYAQLLVKPNLKISLQNEQLAVKGVVLVPSGQIKIRELPPSTVRISSDVEVLGEVPEPSQTAMDIAMDIDVEVGHKGLNFSGFGLTSEIVGHLNVGNNFDARGELSLKNGSYSAYGQHLKLRKARILFTGPIDQPYLDIEAIRSIEEEDETIVAGLRITDNVLAPEVEAFSEPEMTSEVALSYLVMGRAPGADSGESNMLANALVSLGVAGGQGLTAHLAENLGVKDFELDTTGTGESTQVVASGRISDRLTLKYGMGVFGEGSSLGLRYRLTKRLFLEAAGGLSSSLDLFYRRDF